MEGHRGSSALIRDEHGGVVVYDEGSPVDEEAAHMVLHDPRNVVADCDAKLAILDNHRWINWDHEHYSGTGCITCDYRGYGHVERFAPRGPVPCLTVRYLLAAYKHRSGYDEKWGAVG